jgi:hypothetical protein
MSAATPALKIVANSARRVVPHRLIPGLIRFHLSFSFCSVSLCHAIAETAVWFGNWLISILIAIGFFPDPHQ